MFPIMIALSGILMHDTLILIGQIRDDEKEGMAPFDAVVEPTLQRARPVILTALAAILAFIPLRQSVFWGTLTHPAPAAGVDCPRGRCAARSGCTGRGWRGSTFTRARFRTIACRRA